MLQHFHLHFFVKRKGQTISLRGSEDITKADHIKEHDTTHRQQIEVEIEGSVSTLEAAVSKTISPQVGSFQSRRLSQHRPEDHLNSDVYNFMTAEEDRVIRSNAPEQRVVRLFYQQIFNQKDFAQRSVRSLESVGTQTSDAEAVDLSEILVQGSYHSMGTHGS